MGGGDGHRFVRFDSKNVNCVHICVHPNTLVVDCSRSRHAPGAGAKVTEVYLKSFLFVVGELFKTLLEIGRAHV